MKLSKNFLSEYVTINDSFSDFAKKMSKIGNDYISVKKLVNAEKLVIGEVISVQPHPEKEHLKLCKVHVPEEINIVCGAPNVKAEIKVIVALDGAKLPGGEIKKTTIAGYESNGMICSIAELGIDNKLLRPEDIEGIHELALDAPIGEDALKYMHYDDEVIEFIEEASRSDLLSVLGLAYETAAIYGEKVKEPQTSYKEIEENVCDNYKLDVRTENCYALLGKKVNNVQICESPDFIKSRLIASGMRPRNILVDISNYVMLETGQPLHFYDADKLGSVMGCRMARPHEELKTLDGKTRVLEKEDMVITNKDDKPVDLAGVMGGYETKIDENTKNILIELAIYNPANIINTSKKYLRSEASKRYENVLDINRSYFAIERASHLLEKYAGGKVCSGLLEHNTLSRNNINIELSLDYINKLLSTNITDKEGQDIFKRLDFIAKYNKGIFNIKVPTRRPDIITKEDLINEIVRIYNIDNIESKLPSLENTSGEIDNKLRTVRDKMISLGFHEVITNSLVNESDIFKFTNDEFGIIKISDKIALRHSTLSSLLEVYDYNKSLGIENISIFEISKSFSSINAHYIENNMLSALIKGQYIKGLNSMQIDFYILKGIIEQLLNYLGYKNRYNFEVREFPNEINPFKSAYININGTIIGFIGAIHPSIYKEDIYVLEINLSTLFDIKTGKIKIKELSNITPVYQNISFTCNKNITCKDLISSIKQGGSESLKDVLAIKYNEVDENKKSITFKLTFENNDNIETTINNIKENVIKKHNALIGEE